MGHLSTVLLTTLLTSVTATGTARLLEQDEDNIFVPRDAFLELTFEDLFVDDCSSFLLSKASLQDERISQVEYAEFLDVVCVEEGVCEEGDPLRYESINNNLQALFLNIACPEDQEEGPAACFYDFKRMGSEYGFIADPRTIQIIDERISSLCSASYDVITREGIFGEKTSSSGGVQGDEDQKAQPTIPNRSPTSTPINNPVTVTTATASPTQRDFSTQPTTTTTGQTLEKTQSAQQANNNGGTENEQDPYKLTFGAMAIIVCLTVMILFCAGVIYFGRTKNSGYDINQPIEGLHSVHNTRNTIYDGNDVFRDKEDFGSYRDG